MRWFLIFFLIFVSSFTTRAKEIHVHFSKHPPQIDGLIANQEWTDSDSGSGFIQLEPHKGKSASEKTIVYIMQDEHHLYFAFKCFQIDLSTIVANVTARDQLENSDDAVLVLLDTFNDLRSGFAFWVNPIGTQTDLRIFDDGRNTDGNWDTEWQAAARNTDYGWSAELAIPFRKISYDDALQTWGVNFARIIRQNFETSYWSGLMNQNYRISQSGKLTNLQLPASLRNFTFTPYTTLRYENSDITGNENTWMGDIGLDAAYQITPGVITNATINPDFATVEGDQEEINLTRWELSFPEKRLFFLEGNELYSTRIRTFYSRRIGDIDFGGKITGKIAGYNFSAIGVRTTSSEELGIPEARFGTFRLKKDILKSSTIGITAVDKNWDDGYTRSFSTDVLLNPGKNWKITGQFVTSAPGITMDHSAYFMRIAHESNRHHVHVRYSDTGKKFKENVNQTGFIRDDDMKEVDSDLIYVVWPQSRVFKYISLDSRNNVFWNHKDTLRSWYLTQKVRLYFLNKFSFEVSYNDEFKLYEKKYYNNRYNLEFGYNTDEWASISADYTWGQNFNRDFQLYEFNIQQRILKKLALKYSIKKLDFSPDMDNNSTLLNIFTLDYNFTRDLWLRLLTQTDQQEDQLYFYGLFGWRFIPPFSAIYIIYTTDQYDALDYNREMKNEILFLKISYQFGL
jgi:hypothetical protein